MIVNAILKTKLGQDFRAIGMNMKVAAASGIDVDKTRIIAIILSTIMASWGQIIFLQNIGNLRLIPVMRRLACSQLLQFWLVEHPQKKQL